MNSIHNIVSSWLKFFMTLMLVAALMNYKIPGYFSNDILGALLISLIFSIIYNTTILKQSGSQDAQPSSDIERDKGNAILKGVRIFLKQWLFFTGCMITSSKLLNYFNFLYDNINFPTFLFYGLFIVVALNVIQPKYLKRDFL